jgi:hypothetical protein
MDEGQLIEKLKEYEDTRNEIISSIKANIHIVNEILTLVYGANFDIINNIPLNSNFNTPFNSNLQSFHIYWDYIMDKKLYFFLIMVMVKHIV